MDLFDRWKPDWVHLEQLRPVRHWEPCSGCGKREYTACCGCGQSWCEDCIDSHYDENSPEFCEWLRQDPNRRPGQ
jgi:hypothetical protein